MRAGNAGPARPRSGGVRARRVGALLTTLAACSLLAARPADAASCRSTTHSRTTTDATTAAADAGGNRLTSTVHEVWSLVSDVSELRPGDVVTLVRQMRAGARDARVAREGRQAASRVAADSQAPAAAHPGVPAQAIPPAGPGGLTVDLGTLDRPTLLESRLRPLTELPASEVRVTVPGGEARLGDFRLAADQTLAGPLLVVRGDADIYGRLHGNLVTLNGDAIVHPGAVVTGDVLALRGEVRDLGGEITGEIRTLGAPLTTAGAERGETPAGTRALGRIAGVLGLFLTAAALGLGLVVFGRRNLEIVSDTITHSFGRAFLTGLVGQLLLVPTFGMLVVGLVLSVVGILLLPFAIVIYGLLAVIGIVGGYLAVAHAMGETYTRRRLARGDLTTANSARYLMLGLGALFALWAAWAAFGWVPVAGDLIQLAAVLVTWLLGTVGFGAALLSRAGLREQFAGRLIPPEALTDEYLWATPQFGVPAVRRPGAPTTPGARTPTHGPERR
ncbi:MAG TPA: polymer-forming cytoskeletal protein [Gemmatimonadales bacterium]|nr:polymer-forming cytoskeletal protein [Gemmatimonadales bacterium]